MKIVMLMAILATLLCACAPMVWNRPATTQEEFNRDRYECERDMRQSGYFGGGIVGEINMEQFFKRCMFSKGYTWDKREP